MTANRFCRFLFTDHDDHTVHYGVKDCQTDEFYSAEDNRNANKLLELLNNLHDENEQLRKDATTLIYANKDYREQIKFLKNKLKTYKVANQLLKESLNKEWK